jgi:hypothetical protein
MPQFDPSQVAVPFTGSAHGAQELPQLSTLVSATHWPEQR